MKKIFSILFLLAIIFITPQSVCGKEKIGIVEFKAGVDIKQSDIDGLSAIFTTCFNPNGFTLVEREQIDQTIKEQRFQRSKLTQKQMVKIGKILNLSYIVIGDINIIYGAYNLDARVLNVETGEIIAKEGAMWKEEDSYREMMCQVANGLAGQLKPKEEPVATPKVVKEKPKKEKKQPIPLKPIQPSFQQMVEGVFYTMEDNFVLGIQYIAGYRFNNTYFLGGGIGLMGNTYTCENNYNEEYSFVNLEGNDFKIPLFVHSKVYITHTRVQPYIEFSLGGILEPDSELKVEKKYGNTYYKNFNNSSFFIAPGVGVNVRCSDNISVHLTLAYQRYSGYIDYDLAYKSFESGWLNAFRMSLGVTF